MAHEAQKIASS